jgi:uncharacterized membrane protein YeiH
METLSYWIGMAGTVAFAVTAVLALAPKGIDLFGAIVFGIITAVGGGTIRDLILEIPVFWAADSTYIWVAIGASVAAFTVRSFFAQKNVYKLMLYLDGFGVAMYAIQAVGKVWDLNFAPPLGPIMLGVTTAIGGGLIRDVLADRPTLLMSRELYATPVLVGCVLYVTSLYIIPDYRAISAVVCSLIIFGFRAAAIHWDLSIPEWLTTKKTTD